MNARSKGSRSEKPRAESSRGLRNHEHQTFHVSELPANIVDELGSVAVPKAAAKFNGEYKKRK